MSLSHPEGRVAGGDKASPSSIGLWSSLVEGVFSLLGEGRSPKDNRVCMYLGCFRRLLIESKVRPGRQFDS